MTKEFHIFREEDFENLIANLYEGLFIVNSALEITFWNEAATKITGYTEKEVVGKKLKDSGLVHTDKHGNRISGEEGPLGEAISEGIPCEKELYIHHKKGHMLPITARIAPLKSPSGELLGGLELFADVSSFEAIREQFRELEKLALIDPLTQIPNRRFLETQIRARLEEHKRFQAPLGMLFIDIDDFKSFNDEYGHNAGDKLLRTIATTLVSSTRSYDMVGRWGGEEFLGIFPNTGGDILKKVSSRLQKLIALSTIEIDGKELSVTGSCGVAEASGRDTLESFVERADKKLYEEKTRPEK